LGAQLNPIPTDDLMTLTEQIKAYAQRLGFELVGITPAEKSQTIRLYERWLENGYAGKMAYLEKHLQLKRDPRNCLPEAKSVISLAINYFTLNPSQTLVEIRNEVKSPGTHGEMITTGLFAPNCVNSHNSLMRLPREDLSTRFTWTQDRLSNVNTRRRLASDGLARIRTLLTGNRVHGIFSLKFS
jgi:hypothetical protein